MSRVTVNVNGLSLVHEDSGGVSTATLPDVCLTPGAGAVPYPNVALSRDLASGSSLVRADGGHRIGVAGSSFDRSAGGEPGSGGGVTSGASGREATFLTHSFDVTIEGRGACRLTDKMLHNRGNTIDCGGEIQDAVAVPGGGSVRSRKAKVPDPKKPYLALDQTRRTAYGLDTNLGSDPVHHRLRTRYALSQKPRRTFVGRYLVAYADGTPGAGTSNGSNPGLTLDEASTLIRGGVQVFAIWEVTKYRAIESGTQDGQYALGQADAAMALEQVEKCGGAGRPVYFTADFDVDHATWHQRVMKWLPASDYVLCPTLVNLYVQTGKSEQTRALVKKYFEGIKSVLPPSRIGVYGTFTTIKKLLDLGYVAWGWQQAFGKKSPKHGGKVDKRARLLQTSISSKKQDPDGDQSYPWGVNGAGALDLDSTEWADFGQWGPPPKDTTGGKT